MAKIDKTGDAAIMPLHRILMKMCGQTGYTPDAVFEGLLDYIIGSHSEYDHCPLNHIDQYMIIPNFEP